MNRKLSFLKKNKHEIKEPILQKDHVLHLKDKNIIEIAETSSTMKDVNNSQAELKKAIFIKNRRKNPKFRNSVICEKNFKITDFHLVKKLGNGKYGKVYLVKEK